MRESPPKPPAIFDAAHLELGLNRARRRLSRGRSFLLDRVAEDAASRLMDVNRQFSRAVQCGPFDLRGAIITHLPDNRVPETFEYSPDPVGPYDLCLDLMAGHQWDDLPGRILAGAQSLRPDGLYIAAQMGGDSLIELRQSLYAVDQARLSGATARVAPMVDYQQAAGLLGRSGLNLPVVDIEKLTIAYGDLARLFSDLRDIGAANHLVARDKRYPGRAFMTQLSEIYGQTFAREDGKYISTLDILWMTGWSPHESQQKPLKPGSATISLRDVFGEPD